MDFQEAVITPKGAEFFAQAGSTNKVRIVRIVGTVKSPEAGNFYPQDMDGYTDISGTIDNTSAIDNIARISGTFKNTPTSGGLNLKTIGIVGTIGNDPTEEIIAYLYTGDTKSVYIPDESQISCKTHVGISINLKDHRLSPMTFIFVDDSLFATIADLERLTDRVVTTHIAGDDRQGEAQAIWGEKDFADNLMMEGDFNQCAGEFFVLGNLRTNSTFTVNDTAAIIHLDGAAEFLSLDCRSGGSFGGQVDIKTVGNRYQFSQSYLEVHRDDKTEYSTLGVGSLYCGSASYGKGGIYNSEGVTITTDTSTLLMRDGAFTVRDETSPKRPFAEVTADSVTILNRKYGLVSDGSMNASVYNVVDYDLGPDERNVVSLSRNGVRVGTGGWGIGTDGSLSGKLPQYDGVSENPPIGAIVAIRIPASPTYKMGDVAIDPALAEWGATPGSVNLVKQIYGKYRVILGKSENSNAAAVGLALRIE